MSDTSGTIVGVEPALLARAESEAARLGLALPDYLSQVLLRGALAEQVGAQLGAFAETPEADAAGEHPGLAVKHRLEALERRFKHASSGLDDAVQALDGSLAELAQRVDEAVELAEGTAQGVQGALQNVGVKLGALSKRVEDAEGEFGALSEGNDTAHAELADNLARVAQRLGAVEDVARNADRAAAALSQTQAALKQSVAQDISSFTRDSAARLSAGLKEVRAAADAASAQADAAAAHVVAELRAARVSLEQRLAVSEAEIGARVKTALAETANSAATLAARVSANEQAADRANETLAARILDVEDGAQTALEATAETLRRADAALALQLERITEEARAAMETTRTLFGEDLAELRAHQLTAFARINAVSAAAATQADVTALREALDQVGQLHAADRADLAQARAQWDDRFDALAARIGKEQREAAQIRFALGAEIERVEASALAALDKLSGDIANGDALLARDVEAAAANVEARIAASRREVEDQIGGVRADHHAAMTKLAQALSERLAALESAMERAETQHALAALQNQVDALALQLAQPHIDEALHRRVDELRARLTAQETGAAAAADRTEGAVRMLGRLTAQSAEAASRSENRLSELEVALGDVRRKQADAGAANAAAEAVARRLAALEQGQADALDALRSDIARFVDENDARLAMLEQPSPLAEFADALAVRLGELEQRDLGGAFEELRKRIEDRVLSVEQRSVRALQQVSETVALIERRFSLGEDRSAARSA